MTQLFITYDGKPHFGGDSDVFVKAYYNEAKAKQIAKAACTNEASYYYRYGQGYYEEVEHLEYPEKMQVQRRLIKERAEANMDRWGVKEVTV